MKPPPFAYHAPTTLDEALQLMAEHGYGAKVLAGGQSLIATMNFRLAAPAVLIDLNKIPELSIIQPTAEGGALVGAMTRHVQVEQSELIARTAPLLHATMPHIAHPQIRNRGTFGGSIAHADPAAELPAFLRAVRGQVLAQSRRGQRWIDADDFFIGLFSTALEPDEIVTAVRLPAMPARSGWSMQELSRRHGDFALVAVEALLTLDADGACDDVRLAFCGVGEGPVLATAAAAVLQGQRPTAEVIEAAAAIAASDDVDPHSDVHATSAYRRHLVDVLAKRALTAACARAAGEEV
ncbi:MAG: xanthine dehydrogenase family protein subunit M [Chloroflexi bacterium]|nr:xanthine dehydrogenase family protein subunit M [Chloroflexota bacterium]